METGDKFSVTLFDLAKPLEGRLATLDVEGEPVKVRVMEVGPHAALLKVVPESTKE